MKAFILSLAFFSAVSVSAEEAGNVEVIYSPVLHSCSVEYSNGTPLGFVGGATWTATAEGQSRGLALGNLLEECQNVKIYSASDNCIEALRMKKSVCIEL